MSAQVGKPTPPLAERQLGLVSAHDYLDRVIRELDGLRDEKKNPLVSVLQYLSDHIRLTRKEICALRPDRDSGAGLATTADELEEIVNETASAANEIMSAAESVEAVADGLEGAPAASLRAAATRIYEASAFQDITGQRIAKIVHALQHIEGKLLTLVEACGIASAELEGSSSSDSQDALLNGPQLGKNAASQTEIDRLFESLD